MKKSLDLYRLYVVYSSMEMMIIVKVLGILVGTVLYLKGGVMYLKSTMGNDFFAVS